MEANDSLNNLKDLHEEFLNSSYFTALSIMTPREDWVYIERNGENVSKAYKKATRMNVFNLVVKDGQNVLGYINVKYIKQGEHGYDIDWKKMEKTVDHTVSGTCHLFKLLKRMVKDAKQVEREMSPLYFVLPSQANSKEPIGIISFWDLNRAPSYILSYPILVYLEHTLINKIQKSHKDWVEHEDLLARIRDGEKNGKNSKKYNNLKEFLENPKGDYSKLSNWYFPELVYFYENDPHIETDGDEIIKNLIELLKKNWNNNTKFRNMIAHTVNLIVDGEKFRENLEDLEKIWDYGKIAFSNFINPKLSYSTPIITESNVSKKSKNHR
jgi:hypothetical protein